MQDVLVVIDDQYGHYVASTAGQSLQAQARQERATRRAIS